MATHNGTKTAGATQLHARMENCGNRMYEANAILAAIESLAHVGTESTLSYDEAFDSIFRLAYMVRENLAERIDDVYAARDAFQQVPQ